jgi:hypothetical protein
MLVPILLGAGLLGLMLFSNKKPAFALQSGPESIGVDPKQFQGQDIVGLCMTVDIGTARMTVPGIASGNILMKVEANMDSAGEVLGRPIDPRLPSGLAAVKVPAKAISGFGDC